MEYYSRRKFIQTGIVGAAGISASLPFYYCSAPKTTEMSRIQLGNTGLSVTRLAFGTGTSGFSHESDFTRMGLHKFLQLGQHAYARGIRVIDTADSYGTHRFVRELLKEIPRQELTILSKIWTTNNKWNEVRPVAETLDRFRREIGTDTLDIVLMHCMMENDWSEKKIRIMDGLSEAKQKGLVKAVGVSCHNFEAMKIAASHPWVDVLLARVNHAGAVCDASPAEVMAVLEQARNNGKGVLGMKIFGAGKLTDEADREKSLNFVLRSGNVHGITIGMSEIDHIDDAVDRVNRIVNTI